MVYLQLPPLPAVPATNVGAEGHSLGSPNMCEAGHDIAKSVGGFITPISLWFMVPITWVIKCPHVSHHPTIRYIVYNGYYKVMSNIPKMGHLPTPV